MAQRYKETPKNNFEGYYQKTRSRLKLVSGTPNALRTEEELSKAWPLKRSACYFINNEFQADIAPVHGSTVVLPPDPKPEPEPKDFLDAFRRAVRKRALENWTVASGSLGNFIVTVTFGTFGDGCIAWTLWMGEWFNTLERRYSDEVKSFDPVHWGYWPMYHNLIRVCMRDGTIYYLDPWTDPENPIFEKEAYEEEYGPIYPGTSQ